MDFALVVLLGAVQGLTEFLPISSDGHLAVVEAVYKSVTGRDVPDALGLNIVLHAGTLAAILIVYWHRLWRLLNEDRRVLGLLVVGTLPAVAIGVPLHQWNPPFMTDPLWAGALLPVSGLLLLWGMSFQQGNTDYRDLSYGRALTIGLFQAAAILPGISRSGSTIAAGLALGLRRDSAATFSFLLAVPAVGGACVLELRKLMQEGASGFNAGLLALGAGVSLVVGLLSLLWLLKWLQAGRLQLFAWWCIPVGLAVVAWQLAW